MTGNFNIKIKYIQNIGIFFILPPCYFSKYFYLEKCYILSYTLDQRATKRFYYLCTRPWDFIFKSSEEDIFEPNSMSAENLSSQEKIYGSLLTRVQIFDFRVQGSSQDVRLQESSQHFLKLFCIASLFFIINHQLPTPDVTVL